MITVRVRYAGLPRSETGQSEEIWRVGEDSTVGDLMGLLASKYGWTLESDNFYHVVCDNHGLSREEWPVRKLREGDRVLILSPPAGG